MAAPHLKPATNGAVSSTGTITGVKLFGGCILNTDGTNAGTVVVRNDNASGDIIFECSSISTVAIHAPYAQTSGTGVIYYDISGTNADAQLFKWVQNLEV